MKFFQVTRWALSSCFAVFVLLGCHKKEKENDPQPSVAIASSSSSTMVAANPTSVRGTCVLRPDRVVRLKAQVGGEINVVNVMQGQRVKAGQVMATIDIETLKLRRERGEIELKKLEQRAELLRFQIARAEKEFSVVQEVSGANTTFLPKFGKEMANLVERRSDLKDNELSQELNKLDLRALEDLIRKSAIRAPFDGVVLSRTVEPGAVVASASEGIGGGEVLFELADPAKLIAACIVKESDALEIFPQRAAVVRVEGMKDSAVNAVVTRISPVITNESGLSRREFFVELNENKTKDLLPGMNAIVEISQ